MSPAVHVEGVTPALVKAGCLARMGGDPWRVVWWVNYRTEIVSFRDGPPAASLPSIRASALQVAPHVAG